MQRVYAAIVHKESDSDFGMSFPDLPGCIAAGPTMEEAAREAAEAAAFHLAGLIEEGKALPAATPGDQVVKPSDAYGMLLVPVRLPGKTVRANITIDQHLLSDIDAAAAAEGLSRSAFLAEAARSRLRTA